MSRYQHDLERMRKECKERFGCTQSSYKEEIDQKMSSMQTTISEQENKIAKLEEYVDQMDQDSRINKIENL